MSAEEFATVATDWSDWDNIDESRVPLVLGNLQDCEGLVPLGQSCLWYGESGAGKTFAMLALMADVVANGGRVLHVDFEQSEYQTKRRMKTLGFEREWLQRVTRVDGSALTSFDMFLSVVRTAVETGVHLVCVDSMSKLIPVFNPSDGASNSADTISKIEATFFQIVKSAGATVIVLDHQSVASADSGLPSGSRQKKPSFDILLNMSPGENRIREGRDGVLEFYVAKDRDSVYSPVMGADSTENEHRQPLGFVFHLSADNDYSFRPGNRQPVAGAAGEAKTANETIVMKAVTASVYREVFAGLPFEDGEYHSSAWRREQPDMWPTRLEDLVAKVRAEDAARGGDVTKRGAERWVRNWFEMVGRGAGSKWVPKVDPDAVGAK